MDRSACGGKGQESVCLSLYEYRVFGEKTIKEILGERSGRADAVVHL
jgi:hypothetical protein